jgi:hypothetical protein
MKVDYDDGGVEGRGIAYNRYPEAWHYELMCQLKTGDLPLPFGSPIRAVVGRVWK